jgi:hypothetical protein
VLAVLLTARVAEGGINPGLPRQARVERAAAAAHWLGTSCPDAKIRAACVAAIEASAEDDREPLAKALTRLIEVNGLHLDGASRSELTALVRDITA